MKQIIAFVAGVVVGASGLTGVIYDASYREGQIDALNGIVKYELMKQTDSSVVWKAKGDK